MGCAAAEQRLGFFGVEAARQKGGRLQGMDPETPHRKRVSGNRKHWAKKLWKHQ